MTTEAPASRGLIHRIFQSPPVRIIVLGFLLVYLMAMNGDNMLSYASEPIKALAHTISIAIAGFAVYIGYAHFIEQRNASELALPGMGRELGIGMLVGFGLYGTTVLILIVMGIYRVEGLNPLTFLLPALAMAVSSGVFEELLFRGVIYQSLIEKFGESLPTILISVLFSLAHLDISRIDVLALINVFLAGVLLSIMFLKTKSLILPISFHFFWNFFQVLLLDLPLSGNYIDSHLFIFRNYDVSRILYGGTFGVEGGLIVTIVLLVYIWIVNSKAFINKESNNRQ